MTEGTRVVRVSLRSDEGKIGDVGTVRRRYNDDEDGRAFGYYVEWDSTPQRPAHMGYVAPVRIVSQEEFESTRGAAA